MERRDIAWILVVDDRRARLMAGRAQPSGRFKRVRLEPVAELTNDWRALQRSNESDSEESDEPMQRRSEFRQRFAGEVGRWFRELAKENGIETLELFAPPGLAVMLRREYAPDLAPHVFEHRIDVGHLGLERLESRPEVSAVLQRCAG